MTYLVLWINKFPIKLPIKNNVAKHWKNQKRKAEAKAYCSSFTKI